MKIVFVDDGESNRALMAMSIYNYMIQTKKKKKNKTPSVILATTGKVKNLHIKALKSLKEFGSSIVPFSKKIVIDIDKLEITGNEVFIVLGHDNDKKLIRSVAQKNNVEIWAIDNPLSECKHEVKLRFFRRIRDQLWVKIETLVNDGICVGGEKCH